MKFGDINITIEKISDSPEWFDIEFHFEGEGGHVKTVDIEYIKSLHFLTGKILETKNDEII